MHPTGGKAVARLAEAGVTVPDGWVVRQDHARRGLVVRTPVDAAEADVIDLVRPGRHRAVPGRDDGPVAGRRLPSVGGHGGGGATTPRCRRGSAAGSAAHPELVRRSPGGGIPATAPPRLAGARHADGGMANETVLVDLGPGHPGLVVRLPPLEPTFPDYDLAPQAAVQNAVAAAGVPAPAPAVVVARSGVDRVALPRHAAGATATSPGRRRSSIPTCARPAPRAAAPSCTTASSTRWPTSTPCRGRPHGLGARCPGRVAAGRGRALGRLRRVVVGGRPAAGAGAGPRVVRAARPGRARRPSLLWGDVRLGNLVFDRERAGARRCSTGTWPSLGPARDGPRLASRARVHDGGAVRRTACPDSPGRLEAIERYERAERPRGAATSPGTRSSRWCGRWPSTTGTSASPATRAGGRTRWASILLARLEAAWLEGPVGPPCRVRRRCGR